MMKRNIRSLGIVMRPHQFTLTNGRTISQNGRSVAKWTRKFRTQWPIDAIKTLCTTNWPSTWCAKWLVIRAVSASTASVASLLRNIAILYGERSTKKLRSVLR